MAVGVELVVDGKWEENKDCREEDEVARLRFRVVLCNPLSLPILVMLMPE